MHILYLVCSVWMGPMQRSDPSTITPILPQSASHPLYVYLSIYLSIVIYLYLSIYIYLYTIYLSIHIPRLQRLDRPDATKRPTITPFRPQRASHTIYISTSISSDLSIDILSISISISIYLYTVPRLQRLNWPDASQRPFHHNSNSSAKCFTLLHRVRGEHSAAVAGAPPDSGP